MTLERPKARRPGARSVKPTDHIYRHDFTKERYAAAKVAMLEQNPVGMLRVIHDLKLPKVRQAGADYLEMPCPLSAEHVSPEGATLRILNNVLECEAGQHEISAVQLLNYLSEGDADKFAELLGKVRGTPELVRSYCFEANEDHRVVSADPAEGVAVLDAKPDETVRGCVIECESLALAKQLAGQDASRKKMNFCESVPRTVTGRLSTVRWHGGPLTERERGLERAMREAQEREHRELAKKKIDQLRRELRL